MKTLRIDKTKLSGFMLKKGMTMFGTMILSSFILAFLIGLLGGDLTVGFILFWHFKVGAIMIAAVMGFIGLVSDSVPKATRYTIGEDYIASRLVHDEVGAFTQYNLNKMERRHGQNQSEMIFFNEIDSISLKRDKIVIKNRNYSMWNGNGRIILPCEMEEYDDVKKEMITLKRNLKI